MVWGVLGKGKQSQEGKETKNWYTDRYQAVRVQRDLLSLIALASAVFSFVAIVLVYLNIPLVTVEPFIIQVDKKSGITQAVKPETVEEISAQESIQQYFVVNYIRARETVAGDLEYNYNVVRLMSDPAKVFNAYKWWINASNEDGILARLGADGYRTIDIKSVAFINEGQAQVRATVAEVGRNVGMGVNKEHKVIYVDFEFANLELSLKDRYLNPLGFLVTNYRVEDEAL